MRIRITGLLFGAVALSGCSTGPDGSNEIEAATEAAGFKLTIENNELAAWMAVNNAYALEEEEDGYRDGLLIQLGQYGMGLTVGTVHIHAEKEDLEYKGGENTYSWIEFTSAYDENDTDIQVTEPHEFFSLYKDPNKPSGCLEAENAGCSRNKSLHYEFDVNSRIAGITYWQSKGGVSVDIKPNLKLDGQPFDPGAQLRITMRQLDSSPVAAVIYERGVEGEFSAVDTLLNVTSVEVKPSKGPNHGQKHDPPWPPEDGG